MKTLFDKNLTLEEAQELIKNGADVNERNEDGVTPLFYADHLEIMKYLIDNGADIHVKKEDGATLLFNAVDVSIDLIEFLIESGLNVNEKDNIGKTPIFDADLKSVECFIKYGANLNEVDIFNKTALSYYYGHKEAALTIKHGMLPSEIDAYQYHRKYFTKEQQRAFDAFLLLTNDNNQFFQMCLAYQEDIKNNVKMEIKEMDIL